MSIPDPRLSSELELKFRTLKTTLNTYDGFALAFSGGVDSAFLLAAARAAGVEPLLAVTVVSAFFTRKEVLRAEETARYLGVQHLFLDMDILAMSDVVRNDVRRCYHCKRHSFSMIKQAAVQRGIHTLVHGINVDDLGDYRPGIEAANELGFQAPLVDVGFSKSEIRTCAKAMGLKSWDLPSQSCLATRIPVGVKIGASALEMVEKAEDLLHGMGFGQVRVRCHGDLARIELLPADFSKVLESDRGETISRLLKGLGFSFITLDLGGYETGKMNPGPHADEK